MISHTCCLNTIFHNICDNVDQILEQVLFMNHANPQICKQNWRKNYHSSNKLTIDYQIYSEQRPQLIKNGDRRSNNGFFTIFGAKYIKNYFFANFGATNEYTSTWQKQNPILFCKKTTKDAKKPTIDGPKTDFSMKNWDFSGSPYWRKKKSSPQKLTFDPFQAIMK